MEEDLDYEPVPETQTSGQGEDTYDTNHGGDLRDDEEAHRGGRILQSIVRAINRMAIPSASGLASQGRIHQSTSEIRAYEGAPIDAAEYLGLPESAAFRTDADKLLALAATERLSKPLAYNDKKKVGLSVIRTQRRGRELWQHLRPEISPVLYRQLWVIQMSKLQFVNCTWLWISWFDKPGIVSLLPLGDTARRTPQRELAAAPETITYSFSARCSVSPGDVPGHLLGLTLPLRVMNETCRRLRDYCNQWVDNTEEKQPLRLPYSNVTLPISWPPKLSMDASFLWSVDETTYGGAAWRCFRFLWEAIRDSPYAQMMGLRLEMPPLQPFGGDAHVQSDDAEDEKWELKDHMVEEVGDKVRFHQKYGPDATPEAVSRHSAFHPVRTHHYSLWFGPRRGRRSFAYVLPCSIYKEAWWTNEDYVEVSLEELSDYRVDIQPSKDWFEAVRKVCEANPFPLRRTVTNFARIAEDYALVAQPFIDQQDLGSPSEESEDVDPNPKRGGRDYPTPMRHDLDVEIEHANDICAARGYGMFIRTGLNDPTLPQLIYHSVLWQSTWTKRRLAEPGWLPLGAHAASIHPYAPVICLRTTSISRPWFLSWNSIGARVTGGERAYTSTFVPPRHLQRPPFPCFSLVNAFHHHQRHISSSSMLIADEDIRYNDYLEELQIVCGRSVDSVGEFYRDSTIGMQLEARARADLQKFVDLPLQELQVRHGKDFVNSTTHLANSKTKQTVLPWYEFDEHSISSTYMIPMWRVWQAANDRYVPELLGVGLKGLTANEDEDDEDDVKDGS